MKKKITKIIIIILAVALVVTGVALGVYYSLKNKNRIDDSEAQRVLQELVPEAEKINEIIWGKGIPAAQGENGALETVNAAQYRRADTSYGYNNTSELREAISKVYSKAFIDTAINYTAFEGAGGALDENDGIYPRYKDGDNGELLVDITHAAFNISTEISAHSAHVTGANFEKVYVTVNAEVSGESRELSLTLVLQDGEWRLDTPTY